jgi:hypothetical protein
MWIVRLALRRTYTFVVAAQLIAALGAVSIYPCRPRCALPQGPSSR